MLPVLNLGPLSIPLPEFILILGFWIGSVILEKSNPSRYQNPAFLDRLLWISLLAGIVGARLSFFARYPESFRGNYLSLLSINPHLFDLSGGLIIAAGTAILLVSKNKVNFIRTIDGLIPFFSFMAVAIHLSKLSSGTSFGIATDLPWGIMLWGAQRHPVQIYYLIGGLLVLVTVTYYLPRIRYAQGRYISSFLFLTCLYLLLFSRYQSPGFLILEGIRLNQIFYLIGSLFGLFYIIKLSDLHESQESYAS